MTDQNPTRPMPLRLMIVGSPRSGTTLLQTILATQTELFTLKETHFFRHLQRRRPLRPLDRLGLDPARARHAFGYVAERYGLTEEAISGLDPESEPSAARVKDLEKMAKADGVTTVFYETLVSDKTAKTIAADANLKTDVLDPIEGITEKSRGKDYFAVQEANLKALQAALGAK